MLATEENLTHVGVVRSCFAALFRKQCIERATIERIYLVERSTGRLLQQRLPPLTTDEDEARRISSMVTCFLAFFRHPDQLAHYAQLRQLRIENRTYGICASENLILLSVIRGNAGIQMRLTDCHDMLLNAESEYAEPK